LLSTDTRLLCQVLVLYLLCYGFVPRIKTSCQCITIVSDREYVVSLGISVSTETDNSSQLFSDWHYLSAGSFLLLLLHFVIGLDIQAKPFPAATLVYVTAFLP
jgi:hypothetical protein